ncbi:phosphoketolase [Streptomyces cyaneofuscatus]
MVLACAGDVPTQEILAAADLIRRHLPAARRRSTSSTSPWPTPETEHPHGMPDSEFDALFTRDKPVIFAYHGYPWLIHRLAYRRTGHANLHVRGYKEEGTTTTPFDMVVRNDLDRYRLGSWTSSTGSRASASARSPYARRWRTSAACVTTTGSASMAWICRRSWTGSGAATGLFDGVRAARPRRCAIMDGDPALLERGYPPCKRCAVIEDFQSVATTVVDWSPVTDDVEIVTFTEHLATVDEAATALDGFDIVVTLRERVPFPAELFARTVRLPLARRLRHAQLRHRLRRRAAARRRGLRHRQLLRSARRAHLGPAAGPGAWHRPRGDGPAHGRALESTLGADLHGRTLGLLGLGEIGSLVAQVGLAFGKLELGRLEPEPHEGTYRRGRRDPGRFQGRAAGRERLRLRATWRSASGPGG